MSNRRIFRYVRVIMLIAVSALFAGAVPALASVCTLHDHIRSANTNTAIGFCPAGTSHDIITIAQDITLTEPLPAITGTITIEGGGHTISGDGKFRIFDVQGGKLTIRSLTLTEGRADLGGAVRVGQGAGLIVENSSLRKNSANLGGAIATIGRNARLEVRRSSFRFNRAQAGGGAVFANGGIVDISGSSFAYNRVVADGGAIEARTGQVSVSNSSFFRNEADEGAAIMASGAETTLTHLTLIANLSKHQGDSLYKRAGRLYLRNSILHNNRPLRNGILRSNCAGGLDQNVGNLSQDGTCEASAVGLPMHDSMTGWPAYFPLKDGSPAIDAADPAYCLDTDQIGTKRPLGGGCDIGAIESTSAAPASAPTICTLRDQVIAANTDQAYNACPAGNGADTIQMVRDYVVKEPLPPITSVITIEGGGHTISGDDRFRIFTVDEGMLTLKNLTLTGGRTDGDGGAILLRDRASVVVAVDVAFIKNNASAGGAIATASADSNLTVRDSEFSNNEAVQTGGAIFIDGGNADISGSSFYKNAAMLYGGAIETVDANVSVSNSTLDNNRSARGGAIAVSRVIGVSVAETTLTHVTLVNNTAEIGDSIYIAGGRAILRNSIVAGRDSTGSDCAGSLVQSIGNLNPDGSCAPLAGGDAQLVVHSEFPHTFAPAAGSPAIDGADPRFCKATDQIGTLRPQGAGCDIGAIEFSTASPLRVENTTTADTQTNCTVTTTHVLNFRDGPNGDRIGSVPRQTTLQAMARDSGWFNVEFQGKSGWISADYVVTEGVCG